MEDESTGGLEFVFGGSQASKVLEMTRPNSPAFNRFFIKFIIKFCIDTENFRKVTRQKNIKKGNPIKGYLFELHGINGLD